MKWFNLFAVVVMMFALAACSSDKSGSEPKGQAADYSAAPYTAVEQAVVIAGVAFKPDQAWKDLGPSGMRKAEYAFGPVAGESDAATMTVYYFGPHEGGDVEANLRRWVGQMSLKEGDVPVMETFDAGGMKAHWMEAAGTYNASMGGPMSSGTPKENYRMSAVVLEGDMGNVFFKLTGPDKTATAMTGAFRKMIESVAKG